jgi:hypothetical protein
MKHGRTGHLMDSGKALGLKIEGRYDLSNVT